MSREEWLFIKRTWINYKFAANNIKTFPSEFLAARKHAWEEIKKSILIFNNNCVKLDTDPVNNNKETN